MSTRRLIYVFFILVVAGISSLSGTVAGGYAVYTAMRQKNNEQIIQSNLPVNKSQSSSQPTTSILISNTEFETSITQAVEKVGPTVVTVVGVIPGQFTFFGRTPSQPVSGSGVIISTLGYILTNNHVVADTQQVSIIMADGTEIPAEIVGTDSFADLAVLKVEGPMPATATFGNSDGLKPGETVIAIGSPLGDFKNTVTVGVVSATERMLDINQDYQMEGLIQTDAAINQGNSGGPLVNLAGEVVGINTLIVRGGSFGSAVAEGLGFAIASNNARAVAEQIIDIGYFSRPYLGIRWQWISERISSLYRLPVKFGVYVSFIESGSPAEEAGLEVSDIITRFGDHTLDEEHPFINAMYAHSPGENVNIEVVREGEIFELVVNLGEHDVP